MLTLSIEQENLKKRMKKCCETVVGTRPKKGTDHRAELIRVNRIKGQVEGIGRMIEEKAYCPDIITQIQAVRSALASLQAVVLRGHLQQCVGDELKKSHIKDAEKLVGELISIFRHVD